MVDPCPDDGVSSLRAMIRSQDGRLVDLDQLLREVGTRPLAEELWDEHDRLVDGGSRASASTAS